MGRGNGSKARAVGGGRRSERGASAVKVILSFAILGLLVHVGYVFIPIYIAVYDFNSQVETEANYGAPKSNDAIVKELLAYAADRKLPVRKEDLKVSRTQQRLNIEANYTVPVRTVFYTHNWQVRAEHSAVLF